MTFYWEPLPTARNTKGHAGVKCKAYMPLFPLYLAILESVLILTINCSIYFGIRWVLWRTSVDFVKILVLTSRYWLSMNSSRDSIIEIVFPMKIKQ